MLKLYHNDELSRAADVEMWRRIEKLISVRVVGIIHGPGSAELHGLGSAQFIASDTPGWKPGSVK